MSLQQQNRHALLLALGGLAAIGIYVWTNWKSDLPVPSAARAPGAGGVQSVPGGRQTPEYARLQAMADDSRANRARETGGSAVPTPPELHGLTPPRPPPPTPSPQVASPAQPLSSQPASPPPPDETGELTNRFDSAMRAQVKSLLEYRARFEPPPSRMTVFEDIKGQRERAEAHQRSEELSKEARAPRPRDRHGSLKPGNILFAVLQTAINSDEPGPVRAKIVGERFKGAVLLGGLNPFPPVVGSRPERVLVKFNYLTTPDQVTYQIDAYAIDLETARTALASGVDHHYFERYGALIAASFLEGYGEAIRNNNRVTSVGVFGNVVSVPKNDLGHGDIAREALGTVGQRLGGAVAENFRRPNTVTVDPGAGLGILIVSPTARPDVGADEPFSKTPQAREPVDAGYSYSPPSPAFVPSGRPLDPRPDNTSNPARTARQTGGDPLPSIRPPPAPAPAPAANGNPTPEY